MDIGAGFFGSKEREEFFYELSRKINNSLEENFTDNDVEFIAEPGCYYVCSAVTLTTAIIEKKNNSKKGQQNSIVEREYFINDGLYGSFFEMYDIRLNPLIKASETTERCVYQSKIWGQTCCAEDMVMDRCFLPDMGEGEFIVWENMGAYRRDRCSTFTEVPFPATCYIFIRNPRLNLNWVTRLEDLAGYVEKVADLVESECIND